MALDAGLLLLLAADIAAAPDRLSAAAPAGDDGALAPAPDPAAAVIGRPVPPFEDRLSGLDGEEIEAELLLLPADAEGSGTLAAYWFACSPYVVGAPPVGRRASPTRRAGWSAVQLRL